MDVDLLRPGTVPIAPETVLWFEFLLDQDLLLKHLEKPSPDPSAIDLITKFYEAIVETVRNRLEAESTDVIIDLANHNNIKTKHPAKSIALKILSLKVAAFLKWDLNQIRSLPFKTQVNLLQDLLYFTNNNVALEIPKIDEKDVESQSPQFLFALLIYHRWLLNVSMHRVTSNWNLRLSNMDITPAEENIICTPENIQKTIIFLTESLSWLRMPGLLSFHCFNLPTETNENIELDWSKSQPITSVEWCAQINFDLGSFFFYKENYKLAKIHFLQCSTNFKNLSTVNCNFANFDVKSLEMYIRASSSAEEGPKGNLFEQLNNSIVNQYKSITTILQQDNVRREIPICHRINLELDIKGASASDKFTVARDLLTKVEALNLVRCILDKSPIYQNSSVSNDNLQTFIWAIQTSWPNFSDADKKLIKTYIMNLVLKQELPNLLNTVQSNKILGGLFDKLDLQYIKNCNNDLEIPESLTKSDWTLCDFSGKRKPKMELKQLEQQLISTYDHKEIREFLVKITMSPVPSNIWNINPKWDLPIPLQSVLKSLPRGFLQDFSLVMLAKAKEQMLIKNWNLSLELLVILDKELQTSNENVAKLARLLSWEVLLVQIMQLLEEWNDSTVGSCATEDSALVKACKVCLETNESVLPRTEIIEHCVICLLNLGSWQFLMNFDKRWQSFDIVSAIALACHELFKYEGNKKLSKNLWEIVLPIFTMTQSKRGNSASSMYHESQLNNLKGNIMAVFTKLRESTALSVVISMLTRLYNVLKDESTLEIQVKYAALWPAVISNANSYNSKMVCEMLTQVVTQALRFYPTKVSWLRLMGDINFANGHYKDSLSFYLKSLLLCYDYFDLPIENDDHVFRRMIKCCTALGCHTQAAVLCQFLEDPDYVLAFRILGEQKSCNDAVDAYYHCIWDTNILEYLIHMHHKKGEFQRRKCATQVIGLLELNSNNNEEIQREAVNLRKSMFLRALCKQYVFE